MSGQIRTYRDAVVFVTGGASGIGAAIGNALTTVGARVVLADRDELPARELAQQLGPTAEAVALDVRDATAFKAAIDRTWERHGRLDYLFNNAGTAVAGEVKHYDLDDWRYVVDVNLLGVIHGVHATYPGMIEQGFGHIVNVASIAGLNPTPGATGYSTTKHAVVGLSRSLRLEAKRYGVRVSVICPGAVRTPILVDGGKYGRSKLKVPATKQLELWERLRPMDPNRLAVNVLRRVARVQSIIVEPSWWQLVWWLTRLSPDFGDWILGRGYLRELSQLEAAAHGTQSADVER